MFVSGLWYHSANIGLFEGIDQFGESGDGVMKCMKDHVTDESAEAKMHHGDQSHGKMRLTPVVIADYCQVNRGTVRQWIKEGKLKGFQLPSGHYRVESKDFLDFLRFYGMPIDDWLVESQSAGLSRIRGGRPASKRGE
jgi:excisionase family DNA binding protein